MFKYTSKFNDPENHVVCKHAKAYGLSNICQREGCGSACPFLQKHVGGPGLDGMCLQDRRCLSWVMSSYSR